MAKKWVYGFDEIGLAQADGGGGWDGVIALLGGKGANLCEMVRLGVPVPDGFIVTTEACNAYLGAGENFPDGMWDQVLAALDAMERNTGKGFGDPSRPLLVSVRSGAKVSMPGMMDTVLNVGLNDEVVKGMIELTEDPHFVFDSYRRLVQMFGSVVLGVRDEPFEDVLSSHREREGVATDAELSVDGLRDVVDDFKDVVTTYAHVEFPSDPLRQLEMAIEAVFKSWHGKRARDYRNAAGISHDLGTAVNVVTMVFGNMGEDSATGVAMTRNATTGERVLEGDYLPNAQGEDVVAGIRATKSLAQLETEMPRQHAELQRIASTLEDHYREMQDMEFTIERGKLWLLQTRTGKRTAQAAVRIAVEMVDEGRITREEAVMRVAPEQVDFFFHPQISAQTKESAGDPLATGLDVSPGAAVGMVAFDADLAERWAKAEGRSVILARPETRPDDVHGMLAAEGICTSSGGRTSHAALVARQFGIPAVIGAATLDIDLAKRTMTVNGIEVSEGDWLSIDGTSGEVYLGRLDTIVPDIEDPWLMTLLGWADEFRRLEVWANADYPADAKRARQYGAQGIGLCRTEHMFFETERLPLVQRVITTRSPGERREAIQALLPFQRNDFAKLFRVMHGLPLIIRLIDPPLHEFLPSFEQLTRELADLKIRLTNAGNLQEVDEILERVTEKQAMLERVEALRETNPMMGLRGVRLGIMIPELTEMQVRAIFEAACEVTREGIPVLPKVMIPLTSHVNELRLQRDLLEAEARAVMDEQGLEISYTFGTMIEIPRAALTADEIVEYAEFLSFGTNDLTQATFAVSRDDAETGFLIHYLQQGILSANPFQTIDRAGVGRLIQMGVEKGRAARPSIEIGICGEHGGDPDSIAFCHSLGLDYVSCSPFRLPIARLAAAQAAIASQGGP